MFYPLYLECKAAGSATFPCKSNKTPIYKGWRKIDVEYTERQWNRATFFSLRCGLMPDCDPQAPIYVECIDFDKKYGETYTLWSQLVEDLWPGLIDQLYIEQSPSGGMHVIYKTRINMGCTKLAYVMGIDPGDGKHKRLCPIESRGEGGYCVVAPSDKYILVQGRLTKLPELSDDERNALIQISRSFNKVPPKPPSAPRPPKEHALDDAIDSFNAKYDLVALLERHGWKNVRSHGEAAFLLRPGGESAHSATFNFADRNLLYVFSVNAAPFESERGYTVFRAYAMMEHRGDNKAAFKAIKLMGFGTTSYITVTKPADDSPPVITVSQMERSDVVIKTEQLAYANLIAGRELLEIDYALLSTSVGLPPEQIEGIFRKFYQDKQQFFGFSRRTNQAQAEILIKDRYKLYKNTVNGGLFYKNGSATLEKINFTEVWGQVGRSMEVKIGVVKSLCEIKSVTTEYDPFLEYFESLKWNGQDEIGKLSKYIQVQEQKFHDAQLPKMFSRCIHCMLGRAENRFVWTYVGGQYVGKSYLIRFFCPGALKEYYTEEKPTSDKDFTISLQETGFYNWEELQSASNFEINQMKAWLSKVSSKVRKPYAATSEVAPRRSNFFASTNESTFLTDDENTRWLPFTITGINTKYSKEVNIDNCWAQAYHLYKAGASFEVTRDDLLSQAEVTESYRFMSSEEELILRFFTRLPVEESHNGVQLSSVEIMTKMNIITSKGIKITKEKVGRVLSKHRYYKSRDDNGIALYLVVDKSGEAIKDAMREGNDYEKFVPESREIPVNPQAELPY